MEKQRIEIINKYKEKEIKKYVIADLSQPTNYLKSMKDGRYSFIDNVVIATKFVNRYTAQEICNECIRNTNIDFVVVPVLITYEIIEE